MAKTNHIFAFQASKDLKMPYEDLQVILYEKFYEPNAKKIFLNWADEFEKENAANKQKFSKIFQAFNHDAGVFEDIIYCICLYTSQISGIVSSGDYSYVYYIQNPTMLKQIETIVDNVLEL
tara:strand:- start:22 stop:384 length:363 start_codon:yes stop_codon:yes gene_type:complete